MINRGALILTYKQPALDWIKENDPYEEGNELSLALINEEKTVYLISDDEAESVEEWLEANFLNLLEYELSGHYPDDEIRPDGFNFEMFLQWFDYEVHTVVLDTVGAEIIEDEEL